MTRLHLVLLILMCIGANVLQSGAETLLATEGDTVALPCSLRGTFAYPEWRGPPSLFIYTNQGSPVINPAVTALNRLSYASNKQDLLLANAVVADSGEYKCSFAGIGENTFNLSVSEKTSTSKGANVLQSGAETLLATEGDLFTLPCSLSGTFAYPEWRGPPSLFIYTNQGSPVINPAVTAFYRLSYASNKQDLLLANAVVADSGEYKCSFAGIGENTFNLSVSVKTSTSIGAHVPQLEAETLLALEGDTVALPCSLRGTFAYPKWSGPPSLFIYTIQGSPVINPAVTASDRLSYASNKQDLLLANAVVADSGEYKCSFAGIGENTFNLTVL